MPPGPMNQPTRRSVLLGAAGAVAAGVAGCSSPAAPDPTPSSSTGSTSAPVPSASSAPPPSTTARPAPPVLPASLVWPVPPNEPEPLAKERAVRLVEALTAWATGASGAASAAARLVMLGVAPDRATQLTSEAAPILSASSEASSAVVSAQYGGLTTDQAAILVTFRQWTRAPDGSVAPGGSAADVRLTRVEGQWTVTQVNPARPDPAVASTDLIRGVLTSSRIHLPPSAATDVAAAGLCLPGMRALLALATGYEIDVAIVHSAHPTNVFATDRLSDHTRRRALDVWALNRQAVIAESTPNALVDGFMRDAVAAGAYNVGGPRQLSGSAFFSDRTHRDHVHLGFRTDT